MNEDLIATPIRLPARLKQQAEVAARADGDGLAAFTRAALTEKLARRRPWPPTNPGELFEVTLTFEAPEGTDARTLAATAAAALSEAGGEYVLSKLAMVLHDDD